MRLSTGLSGHPSIRFGVSLTLGLLAAGMLACGPRLRVALLSREDFTAVMFAGASRGDIAALEAMRGSVEARPDIYVKDAYSIAKFLAAPQQYTRSFVRDFPTDNKRIMFGIYNTVELPSLTPQFLFSFSALGDLALAGDKEGMAKFTQVAVHSDGVVGELMYDYLCRFAATPALKDSYAEALGQLSPEEREAISGWDCEG